MGHSLIKRTGLRSPIKCGIRHGLRANGKDWVQHTWFNNLSNAMKSFNWKVMIGALPSGSKLKVRGVAGGLCSNCRIYEEIVHHLFWAFPNSWGVTNKITRWFNKLTGKKLFKGELILGSCRSGNVVILLLIQALRFWFCRLTWLARNERVFQSSVHSVKHEDIIYKSWSSSNIVCMGKKLETEWVHIKQMATALT